MIPFLPMNEAVLNGSLALFSKVSTLIIGLVSVIFTMRVAFLVVRVSPASDYADLLKDTVIFLGFLGIYPILLKLIVFGIGDLATQVSYSPNESAQKSIQGFVDRMFMDFPILMVSGRIGDLIIGAFAQSIYTALISLFVATAPIFIFLTTMLNIQSGIKSYFHILIALSLWPLMWNILGQLALNVGNQFQDAPVSSLCFWLVIQGLQFLSPIFTFGLIKNMSTSVGLGKVALIGKKIS